MRTILQIRTVATEELTKQLAEQQGMLPDVKIEIVDLAGDDADYDLLVQKIFASDSVQVL